MPYEYRGDIAAADIAFNAWGSTLVELFTDAARATLQVMMEDPNEIRPSVKVDVELEQGSEEMLLFDFLNELIFYKDARRLFLLPARLAITATATGKGFKVTGVLEGEQIEPKRHRVQTDVKAVTMLRFSLEKVDTGWRSTVVLDV
ncbi:archease [Geomonas sp. Red32]|uniref:archease n=1 Tax=Geomonas sp. Red32 TaxID=2912856 RepID=UPI00202CC184|nr:archease [Geomonas sp. Red32]MCM0084488.1 archease [Geomonas sp. Red32]